jgi:signal transduction histidine kinase
MGTATAAASIAAFPAAAAAQPSRLTDLAIGSLNAGAIVLLATLVGVVCFAVLSVIVMMRARARAEAESAELRSQLAGLVTAVDRAEALVSDDDQRLVAWGGSGEPPFVGGTLPSTTGAPADRAGFLAFGTWLKPESAGQLDRAIATLRDRGEPFIMTIATRAGRLIEARGRTFGGTAVVRFRDLIGDRLARAETQARHDLLLAEVETMRAMLAAAPMPIWLRDEKGALIWVNAAYAAAVAAKDGDAAVAQNLELLDDPARQGIDAAHASSAIVAKRLPTIVAGSRRIFDVADIAAEDGGAGIAVDVTEIEATLAALRRERDFHARTLDQLQTAVAIFGSDRRLKSYNAAYRALFDLDAGLLESEPDEAAILDRLRALHKLPEQADFRLWRAELLAAYESRETREHWWHMPDGRSLRVIANPNPQGGMTWIYENVTERLDLESRYNALINVQGETLDHLAEGVAVFGSDGRLRLHNPSFAGIWSLDRNVLEKRPHVAEIVATCRRLNDDEAVWSRFTASVAGVDETRSSVTGRMERPDGRVIDYTTAPLPDGQTMVTFVDVTDSVQVERALVERAEALEAADSLKNAFIHHVSYELRSPLTNIIGFAQLLVDARVGPLNDRQREYTGYIMSSSAALLAIVNDILDLATIDAGIMELDLGEVDIAETVGGAVDGVQDRLSEKRIQLKTDIPANIGSFVADAKRIRQILFNLLSNAVASSERDGRITVSAKRTGDQIEFSIADQGAGFPPGFVGSAFERFASQPRAGARGGVGLGLSIVKSFVGLHGGTVEIQSEEGRGSTVICRFPLRPATAAVAAE